MRVKDHVADAFGAGEQDAQAVDADAHAAGGWHAVLEREKEIVVHLLLFFAGLRFEHGALHVGVVLLAVGGRDFHAADRQFEHVYHGRIVEVDLGERAELLWQVRDEGRLDQSVLDFLGENLVGDFEVLPRRLDEEVDAFAVGDFFVLRAVEPSRITRELRDEILVTHFAPGAVEVDVMFVAVLVLELDGHRADHVAADALEQVAHERHHAAVVAVGLIDFEHGELGVVFAVHALVAEVASDFEDAVVTAHEHSFQVKFERDAQHEIDVEGVEVGFEGARRRAARDGLQHGRFDFDELLPFKETADVRNNARAQHEAFARLGVHDEVEVTLAVNLFVVREAVPFFGQWAQGFRDECVAFDANGDFARLGFEERAGDADEVAEIEFFERSVGLFADDVFAHVELDLALLVEDFDESAAALNADGDEPACDGYVDGIVLAFDVEFQGVARKVRLRATGAKRVEAGCTQVGKLLSAHGVLIVGDILSAVVWLRCFAHL